MSKIVFDAVKMGTKSSYQPKVNFSDRNALDVIYTADFSILKKAGKVSGINDVQRLSVREMEIDRKPQKPQTPKTPT
jgi:hypothetical protein